MAIKPIQSDSNSSVRKSEKLANFGAAVSNAAKSGDSDAVRVQIQSKRSEAAPPPPPPQQSYGPRPQVSREKNFQDIDSDSNGELSKDELTSAQERRQAQGNKTPFIDRALANYDKASQSSQKSGVSFEEFYKQDKSAQPPPPPPKEQREAQIKES